MLLLLSAASKGLKNGLRDETRFAFVMKEASAQCPEFRFSAFERETAVRTRIFHSLLTLRSLAGRATGCNISFAKKISNRAAISIPLSIVKSCIERLGIGARSPLLITFRSAF